MAVRTVKGGSQHLGLLLGLLATLAGVATWNYQRNLAAEAAKPRPYASYTDEQLAQLLAAYKGQVANLEGRYDAASGRRTRSKEVQLLGEAVDQFNRVQQSSRAIRELGSQVSQEGASLRAIEAEQALRAQRGGPVEVFLRRAFMPPS